MKIFFVTIISAIIIVLLFVSRPQQQERLQAPSPVRVMIGQVTIKDVYPVTRITGKLQASRKAHLAFEVSGKIKDRHIEPGQSILAGAILLDVEDADFIDALAQRQALLTREQNAIARDRQLSSLLVEKRKIQQKEVKRLEKLKQQSLSSPSHYDEAVAQLLQLQAEEARLKNDVNSASARHQLEQLELKKAQRNLQRTHLTAPFNGIVSAVFVEPGDYVMPGRVVAELLQVTQLDLQLEIPNRLISHISIGQLITVYSGEREIKGVVVAFGIDPDPDTNTHNLKVRLDGTDLYPGQLLEAALPSGYFQGAHIVPAAAILHKGDKTFVYRVEQDQLVKVAVNLLHRSGDTYIISGVDPAAAIVVRGVSALVEGQTVVPY